MLLTSSCRASPASPALRDPQPPPRQAKERAVALNVLRTDGGVPGQFHLIAAGATAGVGLKRSPAALHLVGHPQEALEDGEVAPALRERGATEADVLLLWTDAVETCRLRMNE